MSLSNVLDDALLYGKATPTQRKFLKGVFDLGLAFYDGTARQGKTIQYLDNNDLKKMFVESLPREGMSLEKLLSFYEEKVAAYSIAQSDQRYLSFPDTGNSIAALGADILSVFLNQNLIAIDRSAPTGTFIEMQLILWLRDLIGYEVTSLDSESLTLNDIGGMWTSGGNMSNHVAVLVALQSRFPTIKQSGLYGLNTRPVMILAKGIEHFSFASAANSLGLGKDGIVWAEPNADYTTNSESVEKCIEQSVQQNLTPYIIVCVAGNCRTTSIDKIKNLKKVCEKYGIWLHVDACHGGSLLFSKDYRHLLEGIQFADSVSLDPHKGLFVPYPSSYVLFKDPKTLGSFARYPDKVSDPDCLDLGLIMPFYGSRGFSSLKLWSLIKHLGTEGISKIIQLRADVNLRLTHKLEEMKLFVMFNENTFYRQAFVFCPQSVRSFLDQIVKDEIDTKTVVKIINYYTEEFCQYLYKKGEVIFDLFAISDLSNKVGFGRVEKYTTMAMAIGHPVINKEIESKILEIIKDAGDIFSKKMLKELEKLYLSSEVSERPEKLLKNQSPASW